jgi:hypothetical protein
MEIHDDGIGFNVDETILCAQGDSVTQRADRNGRGKPCRVRACNKTTVRVDIPWSL